MNEGQGELRVPTALFYEKIHISIFVSHYLHIPYCRNAYAFRKRVWYIGRINNRKPDTIGLNNAVFFFDLIKNVRVRAENAENT